MPATLATADWATPAKGSKVDNQTALSHLNKYD